MHCDGRGRFRQVTGRNIRVSIHEHRDGDPAGEAETAMLLSSPSIFLQMSPARRCFYICIPTDLFWPSRRSPAVVSANPNGENEDGGRLPRSPISRSIFVRKWERWHARMRGIFVLVLTPASFDAASTSRACPTSRLLAGYRQRRVSSWYAAATDSSQGKIQHTSPSY